LTKGRAHSIQNDMSRRLTPTLLARPAAHAARVIASEQLTHVAVQLDAFLADESVGFHDLRVALRRLRTWVRAFQPEVEDTVRKKARRALRKLAHATNAPRDAESTLEWVATQTELAPRERAGVRYFADRLEHEYNEGDAHARERLRRKLPKLIATLTKQLQTYRIKYDIDQPVAATAMARVTRDTLVAQAERFERAVDRIESPDDSGHIHRVRIAAKRLRYVLETIDDPAAAKLAKQLTEVQDRLGISHDMHAIVNRIVRELGEVSARDARVAALHALVPDSDRDRARLPAIRPGLTALAIRARAADRNAFDAFRADWTAERIAATIAEIATLGDDLLAHSQHRTRRAT